ncbi:MAG: AAA family ATPase [Ardenticatenaceae bacterium]|nr:AAA family ATPase [Ardenticatenaceae bacterium]
MTKVLKLALLGRLQLSWNEQPISDLVSAKAQALLCYLAVTGQAHSRQALAGLLWGELPEADARRNLRGVIMKLRQFVEPNLTITNQTLAFDRSSAYWLDVEHLHEAVAQAKTAETGRLRQVMGLYRGEFMADFQVGYAPAFEDWLAWQRTHLQEMALTGYGRLAQLYADEGQYQLGIDQLRRLLQIDAVREEAHRQLMQLLALNGQRALALTQYDLCRDVLQSELGVEPSWETADLAERIRSGGGKREERGERREERGEGREEEPPVFMAGPPILYPARFFGRQREVARLFNLLKRRPLQNGAIIGPRRSGKTSLLHYLKTITTALPGQLRPEQRQDWLAQPQAYGWVFVDFQDHRLGELANLLPYLLEQMGLPVPEPCRLDDFLDVVSGQLQRPTVVLFDEMEVALQRYPELDDAFWESLRSLATNQVQGNLAFILSSAERPYDLAQHSGYGSPFFNIFGYMATLGPLTEAEARELIASSPLPFTPEDGEWMLAESGRWPILLQILCREGLLAREEGETGDGWREDALRQMSPFSRLLHET